MDLISTGLGVGGGLVDEGARASERAPSLCHPPGPKGAQLYRKVDVLPIYQSEASPWWMFQASVP